MRLCDVWNRSWAGNAIQECAVVEVDIAFSIKLDEQVEHAVWSVRVNVRRRHINA